MPKGNFPVVTFNAGLVSKKALARIDVARLKFAAETQTNWTPSVLGPMSLRTGLGYIEGTKDDALTYPIPFVFAHDDTAIIEAVGSVLRFRVDDVLVSRPVVGAVISAGDFSSDTNWTLTGTGGAEAAVVNGLLRLDAAPLGSRATAQQSVSIGQPGTEHALRIVVVYGFIELRIGTAGGEDDVLGVTYLGTGTHSIAFTPTTSTVYLQFASSERRLVQLDACEIESSGTLELPSPWAAADLPNLRWAQSGDVVFVACEGYHQYKIERRSATSWSIVKYETGDGPFQIVPTVDALITPDRTFGEINLTASAPVFRADHVGALMRLYQNSQTRTRSIGAEDTFVEPIRVGGVSPEQQQQGNQLQLPGGRVSFLATAAVLFAAQQAQAAGSVPTGSRAFTVGISGTWVGTLTLQRSVDGPESGFTDVTGEEYTANTAKTIDDGFDNVIVWYRLGFKAGEYTSGTAEVTLTYPGGGGSGTVKIRQVTSPTAAAASVLDELSSLSPTRRWQFGEWSDADGWPSAVCLFEGRLWWFGQDRIWGSISDAYENFLIEFKGDAGPINRSIGYGPVERINFAAPLQRLILGLQGSEASVRSSQFDTPLSPTNFSIKDISTQGSANVAAVKVDTRAIFIQASKRRVYQLKYDIDAQDYSASDLTALRPDIDSDLTQIVVQRQPDTRIHVLRADGTVEVLVYEAQEDVVCWYQVETDGVVERMVVLPGDVEDYVYYYVRRTINGITKRYVEKFALEADCIGGTLNKQADSFKVIMQASSTTIAGLSHLEGEAVVVWANGKDLGTYPVASGQITGVSEAVTSAVVGLPYTATFKSAKLAYAAALGTALNQRKRIDHVGLILANTHARGIETSGLSFDNMDNLPLTYQGATANADAVYEEYDEPMVSVPGDHDTDSRLYLRAAAPRPCTVLGAVIGMKTNDRG